MTAIIGHDAQTAAFLAELNGGRMHHAWLLAGPEGIGKGKFARAAARRILARGAGYAQDAPGFDIPEGHQTAALVAARSHPDFKLVEREVWQKSDKDKLVPYADRKGDETPSRSIRVIQIRWLQPMMAMAPSLSSKRVIVIDAADEMELSASNALLKLLEEPPVGTTFLLVSHAPGRLLPTIRSRCRMMRFEALGEADMRQVLREKLPRADDGELAALIEAGKGSPGRALGYAGLDIAGIDATLAKLAATGDPGTALRHELAKSLALKAAQPRYEAFLARVPSFVADQTRMRSGDAIAPALRIWEEVRSLSESAVRLSLDPAMTVFSLAGMVAGLAGRASSAKA